MQTLIDKAYKGFMGVVDSLANSSAGEPAPIKMKEEAMQTPTLDYAYPCDNYIDTVLENKLTRQTLRAIANKYYGNQIEEIIQKGSKLTQNSFPHLYINYQHCCKVLNVTNNPKVFVTSHLSGINALSVEIENEPIIMLSYMSVITLNDLEQKFLLGHELGHIQLGHMLAHTVQGLLNDLNNRIELLGPIVSDLIDVPLNRWYRTSEFTADRAGFLCCRDMNAINQLFKKLEYDAPVNAFNQYKELSDAYPRMNTRLFQLSQFSQTK